MQRNSRGRQTYIFESIFAQLTKETQKAEGGEPGAPKYYFVHVLHIKHPKHKDELVKDEIPKFIFQMLPLAWSELAKYQLLNRLAKQDQDAVRHVDECLKTISIH